LTCPSSVPGVPRITHFVQCRKGHDRFLCELRDHGAYGIEAQFWKKEEFFFSRRFDPSLDATRPSRELAVQWATEEPKAIEAYSDKGSPPTDAP
jgi:hypothetical protein